MKRTELIKKITGLGAVLERHGAKHDWYIKKETNTGQAVLLFDWCSLHAIIINHFV